MIKPGWRPWLREIEKKILRNKDNDIHVKTILSHVDAKRLYRFFVLRGELMSLNTSGLYTLPEVRSSAKAAGISYNTLKNDLGRFQALGLIKGSANHIKLNRLTGHLQRAHRLFLNNSTKIAAATSPALFYSDLYKAKVIKGNVFTQVKMEANKCKDHRSKKHLLKSLRDSETAFGVRQEVHLSVWKIGDLFGRSGITGSRYIKRLHTSGVLTRIKNSKVRGRASEFAHIRESDESQGRFNRLFISRGYTRERLQNSYIFHN